MKNQYFGDIHDYRTYRLLRILGNNGEVKIGVCWMLTPDDGRGDGRFTNYFERCDVWRAYDPDLFDVLHQAVCIDKKRAVQGIEATDLLRCAQFHSRLLGDAASDREAYFDEMYRQFVDVDLVFFDPDNGLEISSVKCGSRNSSKYLYWHEVAASFEKGYSLLIYQHFPRKNRTVFIRQVVEALRKYTSVGEIHAFRTPHFVFLLVVQQKHLSRLQPQIQRVRECQGGFWGKPRNSSEFHEIF